MRIRDRIQDYMEQLMTIDDLDAAPHVKGVLRAASGNELIEDLQGKYDPRDVNFPDTSPTQAPKDKKPATPREEKKPKRAKRICETVWGWMPKLGFARRFDNTILKSLERKFVAHMQAKGVTIKPCKKVNKDGVELTDFRISQDYISELPQFMVGEGLLSPPEAQETLQLLAKLHITPPENTL